MDKKQLIPTNEHPVERALRVVIGLVLLSLVFVGPRTYWGLLGLVPLATGILGSCPLYTLFGLSTCPAARGPRRDGVSTRGAGT
jgi:hypothetical protein